MNDYVSADTEELNVDGQLINGDVLSDSHSPQFWLHRQELLLGSTANERLAASSVFICGLGGVGGYALEALVRSGIGSIIAVDYDTVDITNLNRQIIATVETVGQNKVDIACQRALSINPNLVFIKEKVFLTPDNIPLLLAQYKPDYILDAIDNVTAKVSLAVAAQELGIPMISSMSTGYKLDATQFRVADIYSTSVCPLAKVMRRLLKEKGVNALKVVYSTEQIKSCGSRVIGSVSFVPPVAGLIAASEVIKDLAGIREDN